MLIYVAMKRLVLATVAVVLLVACGEKTTLSSPDGRIKLDFNVTSEGVPTYSLVFDDETIVEPSCLGIETLEREFASGLRVVDVEHSSSDEVWQPVWGQYAQIHDYYNAMCVTLAAADGSELKVEMRLYNDGLGLRYRLEGEGSANITREHTEFRMAGDYAAHWMAGSDDDAEFDYMHTPLSGITPENMHTSAGHNSDIIACGVATPVAMSTERGTHIAIHEAALWSYPGMALAYDVENNVFAVELSGNDDVKSSVELPFSTPWRTVIVGDRAGALVESTLVLNLNEPCKIEDTSWIKPMKYVGVWWEMHLKESIWDRDGAYPHCATTENVKRYIDFAAENGFGGVLVEGWNYGWGRGERFDYTEPYSDFDIEELCRYAEERGVELIGHHETYANVDNYDEQMRDAYAYYESLGVNSVKTGYVGSIAGRNHYDRSMVDHYNRTVVEGAEHRLCIDIHEPIHSTGICRTYPNLVSAEGMRGQEWHAWHSGNSIDHNPTLPFTRNVAGAMDFTPGIFDLRYHNTVNSAAATSDGSVNKDYDYRYFVNSTLTHQLAQYVVFYSPIQMVADLPENYRQHDDALQFIRDVPVDWADTKCLDAVIGDYVVIARRDKHSRDWYVGAITDGQARDLRFSLDFLTPNQTYTATIYRDGDAAGWDTVPTDYIIDQQSVTSDTVLDLHLAPGGGFAIAVK